MALVSDLVRDALGHLRVLDANESIEPQMMADAIYAANNMLTRWEADGLALGWSNVAAPDDTLSLPPEAFEAAGYNLAVRLRSKFGVAIEPDVVRMASDGLTQLRRDRLVSAPLVAETSLPGRGWYDPRTDTWY